MVRKYSKRSKRGGKRVAKRGYRRRRGYARSKMNPNRDYARVTCTHDLGYDSNGVVYKFSEFSLNGWTRAVAVAPSYQFFRITRIDMKFIPTADTYQAGATAGEIPNLIYMIDKADNLPPTTDVPTLLNMGAKPIRFDDKSITVSFKPAITYKATDEGVNPNNFGLTRVSPWLATNNNNTSDTLTWTPSSVDHHGIAYCVTGGVSGQNYKVMVTAHFEFKKPLWEPAVEAQQVVKKVIPGDL